MCDDWTQMYFKQLGDKIPKTPCVYFLFNDIELIYIGQTRNLKKRIDNHKHMLNPGVYLGDNKIVQDAFDRVYYLRVDDRTERRVIEKKYQTMYEPKLNWNYYERVPTVDGSVAPLQRVLMEIEDRKTFTNIDRVEMAQFVEGW